MSTHAPQNADRGELAKFDSLAQSWWDRSGSSRLLHDLNPLRLAYVSARASLRGVRALDVGCGGGILSESLCRAGAQVLGIDLAADALAVARLHALESSLSIDYRHTAIEALASDGSERFDVIVCMEMLEHVPDPALALRSMARVAAPGASVFVSTLNRNLKSFATAVIGAEYLVRLLPRGTHDYRKFIRPSELAAWARTAGLSLVEMAGIAYNPLLQTFRITEDVSVNYIAHFRRGAAHTVVS